MAMHIKKLFEFDFYGDNDRTNDSEREKKTRKRRIRSIRTDVSDELIWTTS